MIRDIIEWVVCVFGGFDWMDRVGFLYIMGFSKMRFYFIIVILVKVKYKVI